MVSSTKSQFKRIRVEDLLNDTYLVPTDLHTTKSSMSNLKNQSASLPLIIDTGHTFAPQPFPQAPMRHRCLSCGSSFSTIPNLNKHIRSVHEKLKPFRCTLCLVTFGFKDGLQRHMERLHDQTRPIPCHQCSQRFKTKSHLSKHVKMCTPTWESRPRQ